MVFVLFFFFFQAEDGIRDIGVTGVQTCALPISKAFWHCQPDNGTFELWFNGKNLFPDSGSYVYAGEGEVMAERNWHRQTAVHNTVTLNNRNLETTESVTRLWQPEGRSEEHTSELQSRQY